MTVREQAPIVSLALPGTWANLPLDDEEALKLRVAALVKERVGRTRTVDRQAVEARFQEFQADYWLAREDAPGALIRSASWRRPSDIGMPDDIDARDQD